MMTRIRIQSPVEKSLIKEKGATILPAVEEMEITATTGRQTQETRSCLRVLVREKTTEKATTRARRKAAPLSLGRSRERNPVEFLIILALRQVGKAPILKCQVPLSSQAERRPQRQTRGLGSQVGIRRLHQMTTNQKAKLLLSPLAQRILPTLATRTTAQRMPPG
ncbi:MAG: hypothetical protein ACI36Y_00915 [Coriobacteriales bacterium]